TGCCAESPPAAPAVLAEPRETSAGLAPGSAPCGTGQNSDELPPARHSPRLVTSIADKCGKAVRGSSQAPREFPASAPHLPLRVPPNGWPHSDKARRFPDRPRTAIRSELPREPADSDSST